MVDHRVGAGMDYRPMVEPEKQRCKKSQAKA